MSNQVSDTRGGAEDRRKLLARLLRQQARSQVITAAPSVAQRGVWFMQQMAPHPAAYHIASSLRITSPLDSACAEAALQRLVDRHAMLRTTFHYTGNDLEMRISGGGEAEVIEIDARGWDDRAIRAAAKGVIDRPFNLISGPLVRMTLFRREPDDHVLLFVMHHLICDGWALGILLNEFFECYEAELENRAPRLSSRGPDFQNLVLRQQEWLQSNDGARCREYWVNRMAGPLPGLDFQGYPRRPGPDMQGIYSFDIESGLYHDLTALAQSCGATLFGVLLSAYELFLMRLSGQKDIVVGVPMAGRTAPGSETVVGHFVNLVPVRADLSGNPSFREIVARCWIELRNAVDNQDFPFVELVRILRPPSRSGQTPLFRAMLNVLRAGDALSRLALLQGEPGQWGSLKISLFEVEYIDEAYELSCRMFDSLQHLYVKLQYNSRIFTPDVIAGLSDSFISLLRSVVANPDEPIGS